LKLLLVVQEKEVLVKNIKRRMQYWHARKVELEQEEQVRYNAGLGYWNFRLDCPYYTPLWQRICDSFRMWTV
jgi:hypothetical protein